MLTGTDDFNTRKVICCISLEILSGSITIINYSNFTNKQIFNNYTITLNLSS